MSYIQVQPVYPEVACQLVGNRVAFSPIVTLEPRRRKFHRPITLTVPIPKPTHKGMLNQCDPDSPSLRLLCSITGKNRKCFIPYLFLFLPSCGRRHVNCSFCFQMSASNVVSRALHRNGVAGGTSPSQWEDITGTTPLTFINNSVTFTTSVSARLVSLKIHGRK